MTDYDKLHTGEIYDPNDMKITEEQQGYMEKLYEFNMSDPIEKDKRNQLLKEMLADFGKNSHIEPPFHANWEVIMCMLATMCMQISI